LGCASVAGAGAAMIKSEAASAGVRGRQAQR